MTGDQLKAWRQRMHFKINEASDALGVSTDTYSRMERKADVPKAVALACAALAYGLKPIGLQDEGN